MISKLFFAQSLRTPRPVCAEIAQRRRCVGSKKERAVSHTTHRPLVLVLTALTVRWSLNRSRSVAEPWPRRGSEDAAPVVDGLGASVAVLAMVGELVGGQRGDEHGGKPLFENAEMAADVVELGNRKKLLIVLALLGGDVSRDRIGQGLLAIWSAVVGQGKIEVERKRLGRVGEAAERSLGLVKLGIGQPRGGGANAGLGLYALDFQGLTLGGGLGAGREILTDARTIEPTGDAKNDLLGGIREF